jgi:hypothetical protein
MGTGTESEFSTGIRLFEWRPSVFLGGVIRLFEWRPSVFLGGVIRLFEWRRMLSALIQSSFLRSGTILRRIYYDYYTTTRDLRRRIINFLRISPNRTLFP